MTIILGYGEDSLTLWALKNHLSEILSYLDDKSKLDDCLIFYRPSFGRKGGKNNPCFGEFDSILATSENVYLIESKWDNYTRNVNDYIPLVHAQIIRHDIFSRYYLDWDDVRYKNWQDFYNNKKYEDKKIPKSESKLARNLVFILNKLKNL